MTLFLNNTYPAFRIVDPASGEVVQFFGGKLELDPGDRFYDLVARVALDTPSIQVLEQVTSCPYCAEPFQGKPGKMQLGKHIKDVHFEKWIDQANADHVEAINVEVKARQGFACDVCRSGNATFGDATSLAAHIAVFHTAPPPMDAEGNTVGGDPDAGGGGAAVSTEIPAATPAKSK